MSFSTTYMRALGVDPRERFEAWKGQVGKSYPLYIGNKRFGPTKMQLTGISVSELLTDNAGSFISVTLDITLEEYSNEKKTTSTTGTSQTSGSSSSQAAETYAKTVEKKKAINATASTSDRNTKKVLSLKEKRLGQ